ncbi:MAG: ribbon-helix-helix protein, CopG family [Alphaproteobacteria bacterium]|nr:ribbon-helix-helix protein, CopG family [Alphaproteobacteria bacterium]
MDEGPEREPKKTATIEIRVPPETKEALQARCRAEGVTVSERLRGAIDTLIAGEAGEPEQEPPMSHPPFKLKSAGAALGGVALGAALALAAPTVARPDLQEVFKTLDADRDGTLSEDEFKAAASGDVVVMLHDGPPPGAAPHPSGAMPMMIPLGDHRPPPPGAAMGAGMGAARPDPQMLAALQRREFGRMDLNADRMVTLEEFQASQLSLLRATFVELDANGDDRLSQAELDAGLPPPPPSGAAFAPPPMGREGPAHAAPDGAPGSMTSAGPRADGTAGAEPAPFPPRPQVADFDANGDGAIDWSEFKSGPRA